MSDTPVERAKKALGVKTDSALATELGVAQSAIGGYNRRNTVPLEQCIKIAERTGVSLDWLILGKGEMKPAPVAPENSPPLSADQAMLLTAWQHLDGSQREEVFATILRLTAPDVSA